jgi:hypothetical protein
MKNLLEISTTFFLSEKEVKGKIFLQREFGTVINASKHVWADTTGFGNLGDGFGNIQIHSQIRYLDQIFYKNNEGLERAFQFHDMNIAVREGHTLEVFIVFKLMNSYIEGLLNDDICIAIVNKSTQKIYFHNNCIENQLFIDKKSVNLVKQKIREFKDTPIE